MYVECTDSSFAVNRENWEGVVDEEGEGESWMESNGIVIKYLSQPSDLSQPSSQEVFSETGEIIITPIPVTRTPTSSHSHSISWIAAPIIAFVLIISLIIFLFCCVFTLHHEHNTDTHSTSTNTNNTNTPSSLSPQHSESTHNWVMNESDDNRESERSVSGKMLGDEGRGGRGFGMEDMRGG